LATSSYTEGGVTVHDEKVIVGEPYLAEYRAHTGNTGVSTATVDAHLMQLMAGASLHVYVRRIRVYQRAVATTASIVAVGLFRLTSAGTGGTAFTPSPLDAADGASGATSMSLPTAKGTEGTQIEAITAYFTQTISATQTPRDVLLYDFDFRGLRQKGLRIPAGTANGIALRIRDATAAATVFWVVEFTEASW